MELYRISNWKVYSDNNKKLNEMRKEKKHHVFTYSKTVFLSFLSTIFLLIEQNTKYFFKIHIVLPRESTFQLKMCMYIIIYHIIGFYLHR